MGRAGGSALLRPRTGVRRGDALLHDACVVLSPLRQAGPRPMRAYLAGRGVRSQKTGCLMAVDETLLRALYDEGLLDDEVAARVGVSRHAVGRWRRRNGLPANGGNAARARAAQRAEPPPPVSETDQIRHTESGDEGTIECPRSERIKTLDQLLAEADVDLSVWEVERYTVNKW